MILSKIKSSIGNYIEKWCNERDELLMKQEWGDKLGQYRPMTIEEIREENLGYTEETIQFYKPLL